MHRANDNVISGSAPATQRLVVDKALARKIAIVLAVKVCFLVAMKQLWFSQPQAVDMTMPTQAVEQRLLGTGSSTAY
jgi:hypothetical protein